MTTRGQDHAKNESLAGALLARLSTNEGNEALILPRLEPQIPEVTTKSHARRDAAPAPSLVMTARTSLLLSAILTSVCFTMGALQGCSTSASAVTAADASPADAADQDAAESGKDSGDAGVECNTGVDCVQPRTSQTAGCWSCVKHACVPIAPATDPNRVCPGTACTVSTCNGIGGCSALASRPAQTPCGLVCSYIAGTPDLGLRRAFCVGASCVADSSDGGLLMDCGYCTGPDGTCDKCGSKGCNAKCSADTTNHLSCP